MSKPRIRPTLGYYSRVVDSVDDDVDLLPERRGYLEHERAVVNAAPRRSAPTVSSETAFAGFGDYLQAVRTASNPESGPAAMRAQARLQAAAPSTYGHEGSGADGGFAVPPDFREAIMSKVFGDASLLGMCDQVPVTGSSLTTPKDEQPPWSTSGIQAYWTGEAAQYTQSKPSLEKSTVPMHKLTAMAPVTDELLEDAPAMAKHVTDKAGAAIDFKVTDAIINGTGAGQPLGIMNSPCLVTVSKETSQAADTIQGLNLVKMWTRMPAEWRKSAVWLAHGDAEPQLMKAGIQVGNAAQDTFTGGQLVYMPANTISNQPYATLFGRPVIVTQACQALGDKGDIVFASLGQYCAAIRREGVKADSSIHLFFDYGLTAFRFTFRMGGQPWWSAPLAAKNGSSTYSGFVTLEARG